MKKRENKLKNNWISPRFLIHSQIRSDRLPKKWFILSFFPNQSRQSNVARSSEGKESTRPAPDCETRPDVTWPTREMIHRDFHNEHRSNACLREGNGLKGKRRQKPRERGRRRGTGRLPVFTVFSVRVPEPINWNSRVYSRPTEINIKGDAGARASTREKTVQKEETDPREGKVARVRHTPSAAARCVTKSTLPFENEAASRAVFAYPHA